MKKYLITGLSLISLMIYAGFAHSASITGKYKCQHADGSNTSNYPLIITKTGDTYTLEWQDDTGNPVMYGTGIIDKNIDNVLTSSYWKAADDSNSGIITFAIKPNGSLQGNWLMQSGKNSGTETCTVAKS